jgi:hypothetical protein
LARRRIDIALKLIFFVPYPGDCCPSHKIVAASRENKSFVALQHSGYRGVIHRRLQ